MFVSFKHSEFEIFKYLILDTVDDSMKNSFHELSKLSTYKCNRNRETYELNTPSWKLTKKHINFHSVPSAVMNENLT